jgi:demethylmenaquinone methyltransferase/2-methoxy-6-polyprenyl-1,4-benzoquinol methylase
MEPILTEQMAYYRARAAEYDATAYPQRERDEARIAAVLSGLDVRGDVLELACGTGMWTQALARSAGTLTALDQSPEVIAVARRRCPPTVRFELGDLLTWGSDATFDVVFFAFWLSHVPAELFDEFFGRVAGWLRPGGRAFFVDEATSAAPQGELSGEIEVRTLTDGTRHRIVKVYRDEPELAAALGALGWTTEFRTDGAWIIGDTRPTPAR